MKDNIGERQYGGTERMIQNPPETVIEVASHALFGMGDELEFKRQFAVQFLTSWAAVHYTEYCGRGRQDALAAPPVEDAEYLSQKAWEQWCNILLPNVKHIHPPISNSECKKEAEGGLDDAACCASYSWLDYVRNGSLGWTGQILRLVTVGIWVGVGGYLIWLSYQ